MYYYLNNDDFMVIYSAVMKLYCTFILFYPTNFYCSSLTKGRAGSEDREWLPGPWKTPTSNLP